MYSLNLLEIALVLAEHDQSYEDLATKFLEHFAYIADAMREQGLWDDEDGFFYDVLSFPDGSRTPLRVRSMVGLLPLCATTTLGAADARPASTTSPTRLRWFVKHKPQFRAVVGEMHERDGAVGQLLAVVDGDRLVRILTTMLSEDEFLSPYGLRALSRRHRDAAVLHRPRRVDLHGELRAGRVDDRPVRRELQLARADLVPGQLPGDRGDPPLCATSSATTSSSSTRPARAPR